MVPVVSKVNPDPNICMDPEHKGTVNLGSHCLKWNLAPLQPTQKFSLMCIIII
jgi:hypothetical protein